MHTLNTLQRLKAQLEHLPPRQTLQPYDVVAQLAETISSAQSRGYSIDDVVAMLNAAGIKLARNTVRNYLSRARAACGDASRQPVPLVVAPGADLRPEDGRRKTPSPVAPVDAHRQDHTKTTSSRGDSRRRRQRRS
jgi:hypothetical protein